MHESLPSSKSGRDTHIPLQSAQILANWLLDSESGVLVSATLTEDSQKLILERFPPVHPTVYGHHMTIAYDPPLARFERQYQPLIGKVFRLRVVGVAQDAKGQAALVEGQSENEFPHVTISCAEGVEAKYSNELLSKGWTPVSKFWIKALVEVRKLESPPVTQR